MRPKTLIEAGSCCKPVGACWKGTATFYEKTALEKPLQTIEARKRRFWRMAQAHLEDVEIQLLVSPRFGDGGRFRPIVVYPVPGSEPE